MLGIWHRSPSMTARGHATASAPVLGRYEILGELAIGGMSEVLLARIVGPSGFQRPVVLKRILPHLARRSAFVDMFLDEARIVARIRHPNVVQVHELAQEGTELVLAMEYLEGETVAGVMKRLSVRVETLPSALVAYIVAEACAGLHAAHELVDEHGVPQGVIHRDVSPQNLFVTYDGQVKLIDFGIAIAADRVAKTEAGQIKGKFSYMSPEQCLSRPLDRRSDVFSMGVVLYELGTGRLLFSRDSHAETFRAICEEPLIPPSRVAPDFPESLERICMRALAVERDERYPTAMEMRRDLLAAARTLDPEGAEPREATASLMHHLFPDRILEKKELLRRVRAGEHVVHPPAAEADHTVELPPIHVGERISQQSKRPRLHWLFAAALLASAVGGAALLRGKGASSKSSAPADGTTPAGLVSAPGFIDPTAPTTAETAPKARHQDIVALTKIRLETTPSGARVSIGGKRRGTTPLEVELPRATSALDVVFSLRGYTTAHQSIIPDSDQRLAVSLVPSHDSTARTPRNAPSASKPDGFHRFE